MDRFRGRVRAHLQEMTRCMLSYSCRLLRFFRRFHLEASVLRRRRWITRDSIDSHRMRRACGRALSLLQLNVRLSQRYDAATVYCDDNVLRRRLQSALAMLFQFAVRRRRQRMVEVERRWEQLKSSFASWLGHTEAHHRRAASVDEGGRFAPRYAQRRVLSRWQHRCVVLGQQQQHHHRFQRSIAVTAAATGRGSSSSSSSSLLLLKRHRWLRRRVRRLMHSWAARIRLVRRRRSARMRWMRHMRRKYLHRWLSHTKNTKRWHGSISIITYRQLAFQRGIALFLNRWLSRMRRTQRVQQLGVQGHLIKYSASTYLHRWQSNVRRGSRRRFLVGVLRSRCLGVEREALALWHGAIAAKMQRRCSHGRVIRTSRLKRGWQQFCRTMQRLEATHSRRQRVLACHSSSSQRGGTKRRRALLRQAAEAWQLFVRRRRGRLSKLMRIRMESRAGRCFSRLRAAAGSRLSRRRSVSIGITPMCLKAFHAFRAVLTGRARRRRRVGAAIRSSMRSKVASILHRWGHAAAVLAVTRRRHRHLVGAAALDKKACALRWWSERWLGSRQRSGWLVREASVHRACRSLRLCLWLWRTRAEEQLRLWEHLCGRVVARSCVRRGSLFGRWQRAARLATGRRLARDAAAALREWKLQRLSFHSLLRCVATKDIQDRAVESYRRELLVPMLLRRALQAMLVSSRRIGEEKEEEDVGAHFSVARSCRHVMSLLAAHRRVRSSLQGNHARAVGSHRRWQTGSAFSALRRLVAAVRGHARARVCASAFILRHTARPVFQRWRERTRAILIRTRAAKGAQLCCLKRKWARALRGLVSYKRRVDSRKEAMRSAITMRANHSCGRCLRELSSRAKRHRLHRAIKQLLTARRDKRWKTIIFAAFRETYRRESKPLTVGALHWSRRRSRTALVSLAATVRRGLMRTAMHRRMHLRTARLHFRTSFLPLLRRGRHRTAVRARADKLRCLRFLRRWMMMRSSSRRIVSPLPAATEKMMMMMLQRRSKLRPTRSRMMIAAVEAHCHSKRAAQVLARLRSVVDATQHTRITEIVTDSRLHLSRLHDSVSQWIRYCRHAASTRLEATGLLQQCDRRRCGRGMLRWKKWLSLRCFSKYGGVHYMSRLLSHHLRSWTTYTAVRRHNHTHDHDHRSSSSSNLSSARRQSPLRNARLEHSLFSELSAQRRVRTRRYLLHWRRWNEAGYRSFRTMRRSALHYLSRLLRLFKALALRGKLVRERYRQAGTSHTTHLLKKGCSALMLHRRVKRNSRAVKRMVLRKVFSRWANTFKLVLSVGRLAEVIARARYSQSLRGAMHQWSCDVRSERALTTHLRGVRVAREERVLQTISSHCMLRKGQRQQMFEGVSLHRRRLLIRGYFQWQQLQQRRLLHTAQCYKELAMISSRQHRLYEKAVHSLSLLRRRRRRNRVALAYHRRRGANAAVAVLQQTVLAGRHRRQQETKATALLLKSAFDRLLEALSQGRRGPSWQQLGVRTEVSTRDALSQRQRRHREHMMQRQCFSAWRRLGRRGREERRRYRSAEQQHLFLTVRDCFRTLLSHCRLRCLKRRNSDLLRQHWLTLRARQAVSKLDLNAAARWARKSHLRLMSMHSCSTDLRRGLLAMRAGTAERDRDGQRVE